MLFVLRQLRRLELRQRSGHYFVYAIGEIVLIVVGILIALQIQTWNENRQLRDYEISILKEISAALERDQGLISSLLPRLERKEAAIEKGLLLASEGSKLTEKDFMQIGGMRTDFSYTFNSGPYEALKSTGFERISNEALRRLIINAYSTIFPRTQDFIERGNEEADRQIEGAYGDLIEERLVSVNGNPTLQWAPVNESIPTHPSFLKVLMGETAKASNQRNRLEYIIETVGELREEVDAELQRLTSVPVDQNSDE